MKRIKLVALLLSAMTVWTMSAQSPIAVDWRMGQNNAADNNYSSKFVIKNVSKQLAANPKAEICAFQNGQWIRIAGELVNDDRREPKAAMLEKMPNLKAMYSADDDNTQVLYFKNAVATFSSFTEKPEVITF